jgi:hypothetical protein
MSLKDYDLRMVLLAVAVLVAVIAAIALLLLQAPPMPSPDGSGFFVTCSSAEDCRQKAVVQASGPAATPQNSFDYCRQIADTDYNNAKARAGCWKEVSEVLAEKFPHGGR